MEFSNLTKIFAQEYYAIPDYQRDYEWGSSQIYTLLDDILAMVKENSNDTHFIGAIVTIPFESDTAANASIDFNDYNITTSSIKHVVDGQQRLTSISLLMKALSDCIEEDEDITADQKKIKIKYERMLIGNDWNSNLEQAPKLILNGNTGNFYNNAILNINNSNYYKIYRGVKRLDNAFKLFKKEIVQKKKEYVECNLCQDAYDFYRKITDILTKKLVLVEIACNESSNAFQVFDSLNGKGLDLTASDRIKNIMISWSPKGKGAQKWDAFVEKIGNEYLTNFFISLFFYEKTRRISKNKLPEEFKEKYKESAVNDFNYFFNDIINLGHIYGMLRRAKTPNIKINKKIEDLKQLKSEQSFVLLFAAIAHYGIDCVDLAEFEKFINTLITLIVRIQVCDKSTNRLDIIFGKCIEKIKSSSASLAVINKYLREETKLIVNDEEFLHCFENFSTSDNKLMEYYLRQLENYRRKEKGDRTPIQRGLTVEHIIPKTLDDIQKWYGIENIPQEIEADFKNTVVERIGNKALLYGDDNSSASNNDYNNKKMVYTNGKRGQDQGTPENTFCLISELLNKYPNKFNHEEVIDRSKTLAQYALKIWN